MQATRVCVFCGRTGVTREHVIPSWLGTLLRDHHGGDFMWHVLPDPVPPPGTILPPEAFEGSGPGVQGRIWRAKGTDIVTRRVCDACNFGWLNDLEGAARPYITSMVEGRKTRLPPAAQTIVAAWAAKTALMLRFVRQPFHPPNSSDLRHLRNERKPPSSATVWLAWHEGGAQAWCQLLRQQLRPVRQPAVQSFWAEWATLMFGCLVLQILQFETAPGPLMLNVSQKDRSFVVRIWPLPGSGAYWPPLRCLDDQTLATFASFFRPEVTIPAGFSR